MMAILFLSVDTSYMTADSDCIMISFTKEKGKNMFGIIGIEGALKKIRSGGTGKISMSEILNINIRLTDASKCMPENDFADVKALYFDYMKDKNKVPMTLEDYMGACFQIGVMFDMIFPIGKYFEPEVSFLIKPETAEKKSKRNEIKKLKSSIEKLENSVLEATKNLKGVSLNDLEYMHRHQQVDSQTYEDAKNEIETLMAFVESGPSMLDSARNLYERIQKEFIEISVNF